MGKGYAYAVFRTTSIRLGFLQMTNHLTWRHLNCKEGRPARDLRHLFTTYSFDRELRLRVAWIAGDDMLDGGAVWDCNINGQIIVPRYALGISGKSTSTQCCLVEGADDSGTTQANLDNDSTYPLLPVASVIDSNQR
jgi:hypothetical protein